jgi:hypothetical protein
MGAIAVAVRVRPPLGPAASPLSIKGQVSLAHTPARCVWTAPCVHGRSGRRAPAYGARLLTLTAKLPALQYGHFNIDAVLDEYSTQEAVFNELVLPEVNNFLQGFDSTVLVYGASQTGKTHTLEVCQQAAQRSA